MEKWKKGISDFSQKEIPEGKNVIIVIISMRNWDKRKRHTRSTYLYTAYSALTTNGFGGDSIHFAFILNMTINSTRLVFVKVKNTKYVYVNEVLNYFWFIASQQRISSVIIYERWNVISLIFGFFFFLAKWLILTFIFSFSAIQLPCQCMAMIYFEKIKQSEEKLNYFFPR